MSDNEDDYLSDKFLLNASASSEPKTYSRIRKEAQKQAQLKNEQNRQKGRRQREIESREEGLRKSLFERAKEEEEAGLIAGNKALSIMMKMGFKPGQSLGNTETPSIPVVSSSLNSPPTPSEVADEQKPSTEEESSSVGGHTVVPLPINEWSGKKGIGLGKRARSPSAAERTAKMVKLAEETEESHKDFRTRARHEYKQRRAEGQLGPAQRTCTTLDERSGKSFNVLWLNPNNPDTFPPGLIDAIALHSSLAVLPRPDESERSRVHRQMQADALQELDDDGESPPSLKSAVADADQYSPELLEEATQFLRLQTQDRLHIVLQYLRDRYAYCFWCGVEYKDDKEITEQCPGPEEDDHD